MENTEEFTEDEIAKRRDNAIRRALNTPPKPHKEMIGKTELDQKISSIRAKIALILAKFLLTRASRLR